MENHHFVATFIAFLFIFTFYTWQDYYIINHNSVTHRWIYKIFDEALLNNSNLEWHYKLSLI